MTISDDHRLKFSTILACVGLILTILLSSHLWLPDRFFALTPILSDLMKLPSFVSYSLVFILLGSLTLSIKNQSIWFILPSLVCLLILVLQDISRFQPFVYMYAYMLCAAAYVSFRGRLEDSINALRIMVIGIYFWAGVQKINHSFYTYLFPWFIEPIVPREVLDQPFVFYLILLVPFFEMFIGLFLLSPITRKIGLFMALAMLVLVLVCLGPSGHNWNNIVLPWNIALYVLDIILFRNSKVTAPQLLKPKSLIHSSAILLFLFLPLLSFFGKWHAFPSFQLYSANIPEAYIEGPRSLFEVVPSFKKVEKRGRVWFQDWSHEELNIILYPEVSVVYSVSKSLCDRVPEKEKEKIYLTVYSKPHWRTGAQDVTRTQPCKTKDE